MGHNMAVGRSGRKSVAPSRARWATLCAVLVAGLIGPVPAASASAPLGGADDSTIPREPLLTPQELGAGSVDGLQYGNPTEGLVMVQPPSASNDGGAHLTYPITVPAGRGITPQLNLQYDSS